MITREDSMDFRIEDCIAVLENIKKRTLMYDRLFEFYPKEYIEALKNIETGVIDKVILMLQSQE